MSIGSVRLARTLLGMLVCATAPAQDGSFYFGAGGGQSRGSAPSNCDNLAGILDPNSISCDVDATDAAWKVFAGYEANPYFALEASYVSLGTFKFKASGTAGGLPAAAEASDRRYGISADVVATLPLSRDFALMARAGACNFTVQSSVSVTPGGSTRSEKSSGTKLDFGAGAKYDFTRDFAAQVEYQRFRDIADSSASGKSNVDLISASLVYRFR